MLSIRTQMTTHPILMGMTKPSPIQEAEEETVMYDEFRQIVYDARTVGTKCLKSHFTLAKGCVGTGHSDKKNEIDDSKTVK